MNYSFLILLVEKLGLLTMNGINNAPAKHPILKIIGFLQACYKRFYDVDDVYDSRIFFLNYVLLTY